MDEQDLFAILGAKFIDADGSILKTIFSLAILHPSSFNLSHPNQTHRRINVPRPRKGVRLIDQALDLVPRQPRNRRLERVRQRPAPPRPQRGSGEQQQRRRGYGRGRDGDGDGGLRPGRRPAEEAGIHGPPSRKSEMGQRDGRRRKGLLINKAEWILQHGVSQEMMMMMPRGS